MLNITWNNRIDRVWAFLLLATFITFALGESGIAGNAGWVPVVVMFALAFVKCVLVILDFMELRHAPALWRYLLIGWVTLVTSGILLAWWQGAS